VSYFTSALFGRFRGRSERHRLQLSDLEGGGGGGTSTSDQHLRRANLGIEKLRFLLRLAADLRLLDRRRYEHAARTLDETGRLIGGWMKAHSASRIRHSATAVSLGYTRASHCRETKILSHMG
jgi:hypothetical protein